MWFLLWKIVFFLLLEHTLCSFESPATTLDHKHLGVSWTDNVQKKIDSTQVAVDNEKTSKEGKLSYNREETDQNGRKENTKSYEEEDREHKEYDKGRHSLGESEAANRGKNTFEHHGSKYYKKGHHRTGFSNNYHKDESGNNSSFYEDSDNEGGHRSAEDAGGYYGHRAQDSFRNGLRDASFTGRDRALQGLQDNREKYNKFHGYVNRHNNNQYDDDRRNYLKDELGRYYEMDGRKVYYRREHLTPIPYRQNYGSFSRVHRPYSTERYFPRHEDLYEHDHFYPRRGYDRDYRHDDYETEYFGKYGRTYGPYNEHRRY